MHKAQGLAGFLGKQVQVAMQETLSSYREGEIEEEEAVTGRLVANIKNQVNDKRKNDVLFKGLVVPHSGPNLEKHTGADIAGILDIDVPRAKHTKLFLAQAKRCRTDGSLPADELDRLIRQCNDMLKITDSSYVLLYEHDGIYVADAASVGQSAEASLHPGSGKRSEPLFVRKTTYYKPLDKFFEEIFKTFIGDRKLAKQVRSIEDLRRVERETRPRVHWALGIIVGESSAVEKT